MKHLPLRLSVAAAWLATGTSLMAAGLVHEPFDYTPASPLTSLEGGTGWVSGWFEDGQALPPSVNGEGLAWSDGLGNALNVSGLAADTTAGATTRIFRTMAGGPLNDVWISFLWRLPAANSLFEGVTFYNGSQALFAVSNPSSATAASIVLGNSLTGASAGTGRGEFGTTHLVVLRLGKDAGPNGNDLLEIFVDPFLSAIPSVPDASINAASFGFNTIRVAAQNGATFVFDELRIGAAFSEVTPHEPVSGDQDSDGDGLTDAQEVLLGTDPFVSNAPLFEAVSANPQFFGLFASGNMIPPGKRGVVIPRGGGETVTLPLKVQQSSTLLGWPVLESLTRRIGLPAGKNFLRVTLPD